MSLPGGRTIAYSYDLNGNRKVVNDSLAGVANHTSNASDQYTAAGGETFTYDNAGRMLTRTLAGVTTTYTYTATDRLATVNRPGLSVAYIYDAIGNRIGKVENGISTDFSIDPGLVNGLLGEYQGATTVANYASGHGVAVRDSSGGRAYYAFDANGNTAALTGTGGAAIANYQYLPFGQIVAQSGASTQPFTFDGREGVRDEAGDLFLTFTRVYDATLGRFTTRDPLGFGAGDTNLYRYVGNDPVNRTDPSGLFDIFGSIGVEAVAGAAGWFLGRGINASVGFNVDTDNIDDSGLFYSTGRSQGLGLGINGVLGCAREVTGDATSGNIDFGIVTGSVVVNKQGGVDGFSFGPSAGLPYLPFGASEQKTNTKPIVTVRDAKEFLREWGFDIPQANVNKNRLAETINNEKNRSKNRHNKPTFSSLFKKYKDAGQSDNEAFLSAKADLAKLRTQGTIHNYRPHDPNNIVGPAGPGADIPPDTIAPGQFRFDGFVTADQNFPYRIEFENKPTAGVPAQIVEVTQTLDADLDLTTFRFRSFGFGVTQYDVPADAVANGFSTVIDATATRGVKVRIDATLDLDTRVLKVVYTSLDPATNLPPLDPLAGFLPPNDANGVGEGFLTYSVDPNAGLPSGTRFDAIASIVFDTEAPIATPTIHNLLDTAGPTSAVTALPTTVSTSSFNVGWTGQDGAGSGIASYDVYVSDNGGAYALLLDDTTLTSTLFTGLTGHTYRFYSVATDHVGNVEAKAENAEATTTVTTPVNVPAISINDVSRKEGNNGTTSFAFTLTRTGNLNGISTVRWATADGTAELAKNDYRAASGTVTFGRGVATKKITVLVNGDKIPSSDETFIVNLTQPTNASIADGTGVGTIVNDDVPSPKISINDVSVAEGNAGLTAMTFRVSLDIASTSAITVKFNTSAGTANPGGDFTATTGQLTFAPGQVQKLVTVQVRGDRNREANETMFLNLHSPVNATIIDRVGKGVIVNDD